jgi:hypothetical protein
MDVFTSGEAGREEYGTDGPSKTLLGRRGRRAGVLGLPCLVLVVCHGCLGGYLAGATILVTAQCTFVSRVLVLVLALALAPVAACCGRRAIVNSLVRLNTHSARFSGRLSPEKPLLLMEKRR